MKVIINSITEHLKNVFGLLHGVTEGLEIINGLTCDSSSRLSLLHALPSSSVAMTSTVAQTQMTHDSCQTFTVCKPARFHSQQQQ